MKVDRQKLIAELTNLIPGLDLKGELNQSECFVFKGGKAYTFNDEVMSCVDTKLDLEGAFPAAPLLSLLNKLKTEEVNLSQVDEGVKVTTSRNKTLIRSEKEVVLPLNEVDSPEEWKELPEKFVEAIGLIISCCSKNKDPFALTCIHLHENWVEACDGAQMGRFTLDTGVSARVIITGKSMKKIISLNPKEFSESEVWMHFRNEDGVVLSCRRHLHNYTDLSCHVEQVDGTEFELPKGIADVLARCGIFSGSEDENVVSVSISDKGKMTLKGSGASGWYMERMKVDWDGEPITFRIDPNLLTGLSTRSNKCLISEDKLVVKSDAFQYITATKKEEEYE
jgi:hypothetical protein